MSLGQLPGRPRRCGWVDLVALRFACMINGVTRIVMTKADVLDEFRELQVCTSYKVNGKETTEMPFRLDRLPVEAVYKKFPGWDTPSSKATSAAELPETMKTYVKFINEYLGVDIRYISNGPGRNQIISIE
jgi:adenylosuccinate synthase